MTRHHGGGSPRVGHTGCHLPYFAVSVFCWAIATVETMMQQEAMVSMRRPAERNVVSFFMLLLALTLLEGVVPVKDLFEYVFIEEQETGGFLWNVQEAVVGRV